MAAKKFGGKNGGVDVAGVNGDFYSIDLTATQDVEDASAYSTGTFAEKASSGLIDVQFTAEFFLLFDAASTAPGLVDLSDVPGAYTITLNTGCTYSGDCLVSSMNIKQQRRSGVTRGTVQAVSTGDVTEVWDETP